VLVAAADLSCMDWVWHGDASTDTLLRAVQGSGVLWCGAPSVPQTAALLHTFHAQLSSVGQRARLCAVGVYSRLAAWSDRLFAICSAGMRGRV
jgi:hypothetical protein